MSSTRQPKLFVSLLAAFVVVASTHGTPIPQPQQQQQQLFGAPASATDNSQQFHFMTQQQPQERFPLYGPSEFTPWHNQTRLRSTSAFAAPATQNLSSQNQTAVPNGNGTTETSTNASSIFATSLPGAGGSPANCNLVPSLLCFSETVQTFRDREMRLNAIKQYVLSTLGQGRPPASPLTPASQAQVSQQVSRLTPSSPFTGKLQIFSASCGLPLNVDWDTWTRSGRFHLYFNMTNGSDTTVAGDQVAATTSTTSTTTTTTAATAPTTAQAAQQLFNPFQTNQAQNIPSPSPAVAAAASPTVISATLKLFKKGTASSNQGLPSPAPTRSEPCNSNDASAVAGRSAPTVQVPFPLPLQRTSFDLSTNAVIDEKIRVSVYWYTTPVTKHHYKKKLLDAKMLSVKQDEWVEFDVQKAVKEWMEHGTNYGLAIEVENEEEDLIDSSKFFANVVCQNSSASFPMPTLSEQVPILEICTISLPPPTPEISSNPFLSAMSRSSYKMPRSSGSFSTPSRGQQPVWQNHDDFQTQSHAYTGSGHRRRHHHYTQPKPTESQSQNDLFGGSSNENAMQMQQDDASNVETTTRFELDAHHPLRNIFATAATKFGRNRNRRRYFRTRLPVTVTDQNDVSNSHRTNKEDNLATAAFTSDVTDGEDGNQVKKIVIENIFMEPSSSRHGSRGSSSRTS